MSDDDDVIAGRPPGLPVLRGQAASTGAVALGGALGALARWALLAVWPAPPGGFPVSTFAVNVSGCLLMGVLVVLVTEAREAHPILRPFFGAGVLGGFTTFSSYAVEAQQLVGGTHLAVAALYLVLTVVGAVVAVVIGLAITRRAVGLRRPVARS
ncbi:fluoride efflux transporter CrcB [Actinomycetospora chibensis]|uniref:Fluoride-specific ion channel FluC n=1 Tax=Actinomycetospora chibensis TaxID=663606 RepID=A0ABV9RG15_9PSEU|nr:fluoride efflux transporter CrcB [Actinomycetospora chibensis]MDD7926778.1 fluoride efflux transporter CrcB [Actinomycetospora chibensis]